MYSAKSLIVLYIEGCSFYVKSHFCSSRSQRKRSQPRRHKTEDQKSLGDVMAMETALDDVKVKEELKRGPDLEEEERSKVIEGEGKGPAHWWQIISVKN